jgi:D-alanine--poly(phosphoribitol) ligase subunit 1
VFEEYVLNPFLSAIKQFGTRYAFCINGKFYTYNEFAGYTSAIQQALSLKNIGTGNIGIVVNDDIETYASIWAVWFQGYAYVPLHPMQPIERSQEIIQQAEITLVIDSGTQSKITGTDMILSSQLERSSNVIKAVETSVDNLAYILFTSGSTGKPKGVMISRKNVGAFMRSFWQTGFKITEEDRCLQSFDLTFDVSVQSYIVPLTRGACTYTIPHDQIKYSYVYGLLEDHKLTFGAMAPSIIRYLRPYFEEIEAPSLRYNILTAEASPLDLVDEWANCIPNAEIFDFYGPTEATIYCTYQKYNRDKDNKQLSGMLSIGKAMPGVEAIIIDDEGNPLPANQKGELCVSGDQLTPGYWNNPEKNKSSFFETIYNGKKERFYKTGDSCYFDDDGDIMLSGRLDHQVKIQGFRIELGEIEYHAREYFKGCNAVAMATSNNVGNTILILVIEGNESNTEGILSYLKTKIPPYMIPSGFRFIEQFPLNASSKVDRIKIKSLLNL